MVFGEMDWGKKGDLSRTSGGSGMNEVVASAWEYSTGISRLSCISKYRDTACAAQQKDIEMAISLAKDFQE